MIEAEVTGNVWATRRIEGLPNGAFLSVKVLDTGSQIVAFDVLGSGIGERVLVVQGSVASNWFTGPPPPLDALIIGSIDEDVEKMPSTTEIGRASCRERVESGARAGSLKGTGGHGTT